MCIQYLSRAFVSIHARWHMHSRHVKGLFQVEV